MAPSSHSQSFSYSFYSSATSTNGGPVQKTAFAERSYTDDSGTVTERVRQLPGQLPVYESSEQPGEQRRVGGGAIGLSGQNRITELTDAERVERDKEREYEERMEKEYAKREGGA